MSTKVVVITLWCLFGLLAMLLQAMLRLAPRFFEVASDLQGPHWLAFAAWTAFMLYTEGYRGFQLKFGPRFAARALHLGRHPSALRVLLGPLFAMALFHTTPRRLLGSWILVLCILGFIVALSFCPQPWRGIVDGGVVLGLLYGAVVTTGFTVRVLLGGTSADPELPE